MGKDFCSYREIFKVDDDGKGHPQVFICWHHTSSQRNDSLRQEKVLFFWSFEFIWSFKTKLKYQKTSTFLTFAQFCYCYQRYCSCSPWGECWSTCWSQSFSSHFLHSRARSCLWWWRIFVPRKQWKQDWVSPVGLKGTNVWHRSKF